MSDALESDVETILAESMQWDYWCPHECDWVIGKGELHVGIVQSTDETFIPLLVAAIIPPIPTYPPGQNEAFAMAVKAALAMQPWTEPDGLRAWIIAHGGPTFPWPVPKISH